MGTLSNPDFKPLEFDRFKIGVAQRLPQSHEFDDTSAPHQAVNNRKWFFLVPVFGNISQGDIIISGFHSKIEKDVFHYLFFEWSDKQ